MRRVRRRSVLALVLLVLLSVLSAATPVLAGVVVIPLRNPCPVAFSADPTSGYAPLYVQFTDETEWCMTTVASEDPGVFPVECEWVVTWDFGDGGAAVRSVPPSEDMPPFDSDHTYTKPGKYTVTLTYEWVCTGTEPERVPSPHSFTEVRKMYIEVLVKEEERELKPADMLVSYLNIDPQQVLPGQEVIVSANICNSGEEDGTKTASLAVNGVAEQSQTVGVSGGSCQQVSFRVTRAVPGTYQVSVDGMVGQFSVLAPRTVTNNVPSQQNVGLGTAGIAAIAAVGIALIIALVMLFKKE